MKGLQLSFWSLIITVRPITIELLPLFIYFQGFKLIEVNFMIEIYEENTDSLEPELEANLFMLDLTSGDTQVYAGQSMGNLTEEEDSDSLQEINLKKVNYHLSKLAFEGTHEISLFGSGQY